MAPALERGGEPERQNLVGQPEGDDAPSHGEDVGVVVLARQPRGVEIVAERGADADHFVGGDLLALTRAAEHDAPIGGAGSHRAPDRRADRRIVDRGVAVRAVIVDPMSEPCERRLEVLFQRKPRVVGANRNSHGQRLYYVGRTPNAERRTRNAERERTLNLEP